MTDKQRPSPGGNRGKGKGHTGRDHYSKPARVGGGFAVRFRRRPDGSVEAQWSPCVPTAQQLETQISAFEYQAALLRFVGGAQ